MARYFGWKHYFKPTPKRVRIFGDSLATAALLGASISVMNGYPVLGTITFAVGVIGKFISNFFTDEVQPEPKEPNPEEDENPQN